MIITKRNVVLALLTLVLLLSGGEILARAKLDRKQLSTKDINKLFEILKTGDHYKVRLQAAKVLGMMRKNEALPHLIRALRKDPDHLVRSTSAWALGAINNPGAIADLSRASHKEVALVKKQAERALNHILASFPGNLPERGKGFYHITVENLLDRVTDDEELSKWIQQYFLDHFVTLENVEFGTEMNIEEEGEVPDVDESFKATVHLALVGGIDRIDVPDGRKAGPVTATIGVEVRLDPVKKTAVKRALYVGAADFAGGDKPDDPWADDPLLEAQKEAVKKAVNKAYAKLGKTLKLAP